MRNNETPINNSQVIYDAFQNYSKDGRISRTRLEEFLHANCNDINVSSEELIEFDSVEFGQFYALCTSLSRYRELKDGNEFIDSKSLGRVFQNLGLPHDIKSSQAMIECVIPDQSHITFAQFHSFILDSFGDDLWPSTEHVLRKWHYDANLSKERKGAIPLTPLQDFLAGTIGGIALTVVGHPFDTAKIRMQTNSHFSSAFQVARNALQKEGIFSLWKGMTGPLATIPAINAVVFVSYGQAKTYLQGDSDELTFSQGLLAGSYAGFVSSWIVGPTELIKTRLQIQYNAPGEVAKYRGPLDCIRAIVQTEGGRGLFRGMTATIARETTGYAGQFGAYELCKRLLVPEGGTEADLSYGALMFSGGVSGIAAWLFPSYWFDQIKTQLVVSQRGTYKRHSILPDGGMIDCFRSMVKTKGYLGLWRGIGPCIARAFPANACGFLVYEISSEFLKDHQIGA